MLLNIFDLDLEFLLLAYEVYHLTDRHLAVSLISTCFLMRIATHHLGFFDDLNLFEYDGY